MQKVQVFSILWLVTCGSFAFAHDSQGQVCDVQTLIDRLTQRRQDYKKMMCEQELDLVVFGSLIQSRCKSDEDKETPSCKSLIMTEHFAAKEYEIQKLFRDHLFEYHEQIQLDPTHYLSTRLMLDDAVAELLKKKDVTNLEELQALIGELRDSANQAKKQDALALLKLCTGMERSSNPEVVAGIVKGLVSSKLENNQ